MDEFGFLTIQPFLGKAWFEKEKPDRLPATYHRNQGVRHLMAALDLQDDKLYGHPSAHKKHQDILRFLSVLRRCYHHSERLYIILDNFPPHKHAKVTVWANQNNVELVFTAMNASWMNRIECHFGPLHKFVLSGSNYRSHKELAQAIRAYIHWRKAQTQQANSKGVKEDYGCLMGATSICLIVLSNHNDVLLSCHSNLSSYACAVC